MPGSGVVHAMGGIIALVGGMIVGPRIGKYVNGKPRAIPGHNIPMVCVGTFILAFGWFGFNPGSTLAGTDLRISFVVVNTMLAGTTACLGCMFWLMFVRGMKPDPSMMCNGMLAGLVAITAPSAFVNTTGAGIIGLIAGIVVVESVFFFDKAGVDDVVGAISVHGVNGLWGVISVGLFATGEYGAGWNGVDRFGLRCRQRMDQSRLCLRWRPWLVLWRSFAALRSAAQLRRRDRRRRRRLVRLIQAQCLDYADSGQPRNGVGRPRRSRNGLAGLSRLRAQRDFPRRLKSPKRNRWFKRVLPPSDRMRTVPGCETTLSGSPAGCRKGDFTPPPAACVSQAQSKSCERALSAARARLATNLAFRSQKDASGLGGFPLKSEVLVMASDAASSGCSPLPWTGGMDFNSARRRARGRSSAERRLGQGV